MLHTIQPRALASCRPRALALVVVLVLSASQWPAGAIETIDDTDTGDAYRYSPGWTPWKGNGPRGETLHYANRAGCTARLTFVGTRVELLHKIGPDCGIARITVDGRLVAEQLDTYAPAVEWNHRTVLAENLTQGQHTVTVEVTGQRDEASSNTYVQIVGFGVDDPGWHTRGEELRRQHQREAETRLAGYRQRCPKFAFVKRHHFRSPGAGGVLLCWNVFTPGGGIYIYDPRLPDEQPEEIFRRDSGVIFDMIASFDATKLLFSWMDLSEPGVDSFHVYEINVDGTGLRQLTEGRYHDVSPVYLPDGKICFISTRVESFSMCQDAAASAMHVMEGDGSNIRRIQFGTLADFSPYVLDDGSILFTRWEYQDKSVFSVQSLWTINPDGTRVSLFYGNTITVPNTIWQAKPMPGTNSVICTLAPHHRNLVGAIGILDRRLGVENPRALRNLTPEIPYEPTTDPRWQPGDRLFYWSYRDPYPVAEDLFLVAYGGGGPERYRIYAMDTAGEKVPLLEDPKISCFNPVPLVRRPHPHVVSPHESTGEPMGTFLLTDVYQGLDGVPRGAVKQLRVMSQVPRPTNNRGARAFFKGHDIVDPVVGAGTFYVKHNYGTVPVRPDGSAWFKAPAGVELYFQALDVDGKELRRMGSITQLMPGETQSCVGCHESRYAAPPHWQSAPKALAGQPDEITPPKWGAGPVDFVRHVQPVLDRYCAECHGGADPDGGIDLSGDKTRHFNMAYDTLARLDLIQFYYLTPPQEETGIFGPMKTGSHASRIVKLIDQQHEGVKMDAASRRSLYTWIEANIPYYGTYEHTRPGTPGSRDAWAAPWFADLNTVYGRRCGACHGPLDSRGDARGAWVNLTRPESSRVLNAPLAKTAGGLQLCGAKNGKQPSLFQDKTDADFQTMLRAIEAGCRALREKPRMDMPGAVRSPYEQDFGRLF